LAGTALNHLQGRGELQAEGHASCHWCDRGQAAGDLELSAVDQAKIRRQALK
jgi:hypothetical protein